MTRAFLWCTESHTVSPEFLRENGFTRPVSSPFSIFMDLPIYFLFPLVQMYKFGVKTSTSMARSVAAFPACTRVSAAPIVGAPGCACFHMIDCGSALVSGRWPCACSAERDQDIKADHGSLGGCVPGLYTRACSPKRRCARLCVFSHD